MYQHLIILFQFPDLRDEAAVQRFFLEQIQKGEEYLAQGSYENGVEHLTNAIAVCGRPQHLLGVLKANIPPEVFKMLTDNLSTIGEVKKVIFFIKFFSISEIFQRLATSPTMMMAASKAASVKVSAADSTSESKITEIGDAPSAPSPASDPTAASIVDVDELE